MSVEVFNTFPNNSVRTSDLSRFWPKGTLGSQVMDEICMRTSEVGPNRVNAAKRALAGDGATIQNKGEQGIHRDAGTGEIMRRDPGARTLIEKVDDARKNGVQNQGEEG